MSVIDDHESLLYDILLALTIDRSLTQLCQGTIGSAFKLALRLSETLFLLRKVL